MTPTEPVSPESLDERIVERMVNAAQRADADFSQEWCRRNRTWLAVPTERMQVMMRAALAALPEQGPPLDEWLKGDEAIKAIEDNSPAAKWLTNDEARVIRDALLEALAEHRKQGKVS